MSILCNANAILHDITAHSGIQSNIYTAGNDNNAVINNYKVYISLPVPHQCQYIFY